MGRRSGNGLQGDESTHRLVLSALPMLHKVARQVLGVSSSTDAADLVQTGLVVACEQAPRFDPTRGVTFSRFIERRARTAMLETLEQLRSPSHCEPDMIAADRGSTEWRVFVRCQINEALAPVAIADQQVFAACMLAECTLAEAARMTGGDYHAVWYRFEKTKQRVRNVVVSE